MTQDVSDYANDRVEVQYIGENNGSPYQRMIHFFPPPKMKTVNHLYENGKVKVWESEIENDMRDYKALIDAKKILDK